MKRLEHFKIISTCLYVCVHWFGENEYQNVRLKSTNTTDLLIKVKLKRYPGTQIRIEVRYYFGA